MPWTTVQSRQTVTCASLKPCPGRACRGTLSNQGGQWRVLHGAPPRTKALLFPFVGISERGASDEKGEVRELCGSNESERRLRHPSDITATTRNTSRLHAVSLAFHGVEVGPVRDPDLCPGTPSAPRGFLHGHEPPSRTTIDRCCTAEHPLPPACRYPAELRPPARLSFSGCGGLQ